MSFLRKLFTRKKPNTPKTPKNPKTPKKTKLKPDETPDVWIVESLAQYTASPSWTHDIENFIDTRCYIFDNPEENLHEHYTAYKDFVALVETKLETMLATIGVTAEQLFEALKGVQDSPRYKKFVGQILNLEDYELFKKMMCNRNKVLEHETAAFMGKKVDPADKEQAELEYALELSKKMHDEYLQQLDEEAEMLKRALKESEESFKREMAELNLAIKDKYLKQADKGKSQPGGANDQKDGGGVDKDSQDNKGETQADNRDSKTKELEHLQHQELLEKKRQEAEARKKELAARMDKEKNNLEQRLQELEKLKKLKIDSDEDQNNDDNGQPNEKQENKGESLEERRQRLIKQRELFLKVRKEQREKELAAQKPELEYNNGKESKLNSKELSDRKEIYEKVITQKK